MFHLYYLNYLKYLNYIKYLSFPFYYKNNKLRLYPPIKIFIVGTLKNILKIFIVGILKNILKVFNWVYLMGVYYNHPLKFL